MNNERNSIPRIILVGLIARDDDMSMLLCLKFITSFHPCERKKKDKKCETIYIFMGFSRLNLTVSGFSTNPLNIKGKQMLCIRKLLKPAAISDTIS